MLSADHLHEFVVIVDEGSISSAARQLGRPRATLSRRLASLEQALGVRLLHRETRRQVLTPAGQELYVRAQRVVADTAAAWAAVRQLDDVPRGPLRVSVVDGQMAASDLFVEFARDFPEVRLEVTATARHVDLVAEGIDVAVRFGTIDNPALIAKRLWSDRNLAAAAPAYLAARGTPTDVAALAGHDLVVGFSGDRLPTREWPLLDGGRLRVEHRLASSDLLLRLRAVREGLGIGLLPAFVIREDLMAGRLVPVLEDVIGAALPAHLVFVDRELQTAPVRAFIERATDFYRRTYGSAA